MSLEKKVHPIFRISASDGRRELLGTCFALNHTTHMLTAAHCVEGVDYNEVWVGKEADRKVTSVIFHETADVAIMEAERLRGPDELDEVFRRIYQASPPSQFKAYGFQVGEVGSASDGDVVGLHKQGILQSTFDLENSFSSRADGSHYAYKCFRLDLLVISGNSGSPVIDPGSGQVVGIITEQYHGSSTQAGVQVSNGHGHALDLMPMKVWVNSIVPRSR